MTFYKLNNYNENYGMYMFAVDKIVTNPECLQLNYFS